MQATSDKRVQLVPHTEAVTRDDTSTVATKWQMPQIHEYFEGQTVIQKSKIKVHL